VTVDRSSAPKLARHARLRWDAARSRWVLLAPERILLLDEIAHDVLRRCDGEATVGAISAALAESYRADLAEVERDVVELIAELAAKRLVET
jgi:pyrroloquinoline quinone biosynthesis protein D